MKAIDIQTARTRIFTALSAHQAQVEWVTPEKASGRITARNLTAPQPYPPYRKSPFDGYALHSTKSQTYTVLATIGAGFVYDQPVPAGYAIRLMTGCAVPPDCDLVVPQEYVKRAGDVAFVQQEIIPGSNIIPRGEECQAGEIIIPQGTRLSAGAVAAAVGLGSEKIPVYQQPQVLLLTSGQELVMPGKNRGPGQIYNSNAFLLAPLLKKYGAALTFLQLSDAPAKFTREIKRIQALIEKKTLVISTGGVSVGLFDTMPQIYESLGAKKLYDRITMRPGSASYGGLRQDKTGFTLFLGLSGNPAAAFNAFHLLAIPALRRLGGEKKVDFPLISCQLTAPIQKKNPVDRFVQGKLSWQAGKACFTPNTTLTSSALLGLTQTNALGCLKKGAPPLAKGDSIDVLYLVEG